MTVVRMGPEKHYNLCRMLQTLAQAMEAADECNVKFDKGDALLVRFLEGSLALFRDAGYTPEDIVEAWKANFGK